jgi:peptidoglycan/xylan/chitin deacetylase (PgdA/CDA1 family)
MSPHRTVGMMLVVASVAALTAQDRRVAITIDDLPRGGDLAGGCAASSIEAMTVRLLAPVRRASIPVTGFVNEGRCPELGEAGLKRILTLWLDAGAELGNHTYSHPDLNSTPLADAEHEVIRGETLTRQLLGLRGRKLRYFRHPFLHVGLDLEKRHTFEHFLSRRGYRVAPVTLDNSDYMFAAVYAEALERGDRALANRVRAAYLPYMESIFGWFEKRSVEVTGHEIAQILLIHASRLNADAWPELLTMMRSRGYKFVTLDEALKDPAYSLPDTYAGHGGFSWIHHWSITKGMPKKGEPDEPRWIAQAFERTRR